ncbi:DUF1003 domain-containing protein [Massilia agilis]|uniref:DUF1003 domain-containing protein n=1 Tax=Massilia agilis TaxID=1811226 RepID=A0ABT2DCR0_9BURK|nr:DUF1003 domain-containing protein [Massilia agilis]MCS0808994.1 DUF1003 domain-containing protein [Massilia agilis]
MSADADQNAKLPDSVHENIGTIAEFYARHEERLSLPQAIVERISLFFGSPGYVAGSVVFVVCWIVANLVAPKYGGPQIDEPPFFWLQGIITLNAFIISTTVLIRQHRMSKLAEHHAHLDLQVNLLAEEKSSKIIAMLEELRRDLPTVRNKTDHEAEEMARPADPKAVLSAIERENQE